MTEGIVRSHEDFSVGRVLAGTFGVLINNALPIFLTAFLVIGLPQILLYSLPTLGLYLNSVFNLFSVIVSFLTQTFLILILTPFCISAFNEEVVTIRDCRDLARPFFVSALAFSFLSGLGIFFGLLLFIIPGVIFMVMWAVGIPAMITESLNSSGAFERSASLTQGYRWWVFLVMVIVFLFVSFQPSLSAW